MPAVESVRFRFHPAQQSPIHGFAADPTLEERLVLRDPPLDGVTTTAAATYSPEVSHFSPVLLMTMTPFRIADVLVITPTLLDQRCEQDCSEDSKRRASLERSENWASFAS
jgi:hypothetical protein